MDTIVDHFAEKMWLDAAIGRSHELKNGIYTGRTMQKGSSQPSFELLNKVDILKDFIRSRNLKTNLKDAIAVGDSEGDIALLSIVGHPIAFNPSRLLVDVAKKKKWQIVVERKDVIYHIISCTIKS
jgi:phosphoserine phosphatase